LFSASGYSGVDASAARKPADGCVEIAALREQRAKIVVGLGQIGLQGKGARMRRGPGPSPRSWRGADSRTEKRIPAPQMQ